MKALATALASVVLCGLVWVPTAEAAGDCTRVCVEGGAGSVTTRARHGVSDAVSGRGDGSQGQRSEAHDWYEIEEFAAPTCAGNELLDGDLLCGAAVNSCPAVDQIRFWVWHRRTDHLVGPPPRVEVGEWTREPGSFCLGPDDPGVPSIVTTIAQSQDAFEERIRRLAPPRVSTSPGPRTLVNYDTDLTVDGAEPFAFDVTVAGVTVHLDVRPTRFTWTFGDGATEETTVPSTTHTYRTNRTVQVRVDVEWGGTFTVGDAPETYPIDPPATTTGTPTPLTVVTARAELVTR